MSKQCSDDVGRRPATLAARRHSVQHNTHTYAKGSLVQGRDLNRVRQGGRAIVEVVEGGVTTVGLVAQHGGGGALNDTRHNCNDTAAL